MIQDPRKSPDPLQKLIDLSLAHRPRHCSLKISSKSAHNFLRYFAHNHTERYTHRPLQKHNPLGGGKNKFKSLTQ